MTKSYKKKLIEVALPLEAINTASAKEKSIRHGHPSTLHLWWARRPLAACRAVLFAQLVDDPSEYVDLLLQDEDTRKEANLELAERLKLWDRRQAEPDSAAMNSPKPTLEDCASEIERRRLFKIIADLVKWENSTSEEVLEQARAEIRRCCGEDMPAVYDPFSGGGSIPLEAQRLGLPAYGSDLNPVAVLIGKAMLELPYRFRGQKPVHAGIQDRLHYENTQGLAEDIKYYGERLKEQSFAKVGHLYPEISIPKDLGGGEAQVLAYLWCRTVPSPNPAFADVYIPLVRTFELLKKPKNHVWVEPRVDKENGAYSFVICRGSGKAPGGTVSRNGGLCIMSGDAVPLNYIREQAQAGRMKEKLLAVVVKAPAGREYVAPTTESEELAKSTKPSWRPDARIPEKHRNFQTPLYGMPTFGDIFTDRQAVAINSFIDSLSEIRSEILEDSINAFGGTHGNGILDGGAEALAYTQSILIYLSFAISKATTRNCSLAIWEPGMGRLAGAMGRQALPMQWAYAETNPFAGAGGDIAGTAQSVAEVVDAFVPTSTGAVFQRNASDTTPLDFSPLISTDPPYYDNIEYAELSDFFYVWLRRSLANEFPSLFETLVVPKQEELVASTNRYGSKENAEKHFLDGMSLAIANMTAEANENFPVAIYYAFKQSEVEVDGVASAGWATFLSAVIHAGFSVVGTWPIRTEATNALKKGMNALASSVVLVCRRKAADADTVTRAEFVRALKRELPPAIAELQAASIAPADMPQSAIGPGMGVFSRYSAVLEADDSPMTVKAALQLINRELDEYLGGIQGEFDADTRFAITWFEQNGMQSGDYGTAANIATARGVAVESVKHAGIVESSAGLVRILAREELDASWDPATDSHLTVWECLQYLVRQHQNDGISYNTALLLKKIGDQAEAAKDLAYCLYDISANKRQDPQEASAYNALISDWTELTRAADSIEEIQVDGQTRMDF